MAGGGVWFSGATEALRSFAERTRIPVLANGKGRACLPEDHPLSGGGFMSLAAVRQSGGPDVVLMLGARLGLFTGGAQGSLIPESAHLIQVDIEGEEIGRNREVQTGVVADCAATLRALSEAAKARTWTDRTAWTRRPTRDTRRAWRHCSPGPRPPRRPSTRTASRATSRPSWIAPTTSSSATAARRHSGLRWRLPSADLVSGSHTATSAALERACHSLWRRRLPIRKHACSV